MNDSRKQLQAAADEFGWDRREGEKWPAGQRLTFSRPDGARIGVFLDAVGLVRSAEWRDAGGSNNRINGGASAVIAALRTHRPR